MCSGGIRAQQRLAEVKTTGCNSQSWPWFLIPDAWIAQTCVCGGECGEGGGGGQETITDQMQAVNKATQGHNRSIKSALLGWSGYVSEAAVYTQLFQLHHTKLVTTYLCIYLINCMLMTKQASCCELLFVAHLETRASVAMLLFRGIWNYYHIEGNQSLVLLQSSGQHCAVLLWKRA